MPPPGPSSPSHFHNVLWTPPHELVGSVLFDGPHCGRHPELQWSFSRILSPHNSPNSSYLPPALHLTAVVCVVLEFLVYQTTVSTETLVCLFVVILGAYIYASNKLVFNFVGYCWATANIVLMACNQMLVRRIGPAFNAWEMSMYMNIQSVFIFMVTLPFTGASANPIISHPTFAHLFSTLGELAPATFRLGELFGTQDYQSLNAIALSCVSALLISFAATKASLSFMAVTFLTLNNLVKVFLLTENRKKTARGTILTYVLLSPIGCR